MILKTTKRLESLDILRGLDLFLLVGLQPIFVTLGKNTNSIFFQHVLYQFDHEIWQGLRLWDMIMPLFLFMTGVTLPFSMDSKKELPKLPLYLQLLRRFVILWILGMVMQGNLLTLDWHQLRLYSNTLQAIAMGYLVASIFYLHFGLRTLYVIAVLLLLIYPVPLWIVGDFSPQGNFAIQVDRAVLGHFMDGAYWEQGHWYFSSSYNYTWIWSSLTFTVTVLMGCFAGKWIKDAFQSAPYRALQRLIVWGAICIVLGLGMDVILPIVKRIWTSSMVLFSGGISFLLMAFFYYVVDIKGKGKWLSWLKIYGMNSIVAYFLGEFVDFRSVVHSLTYGMEHLWPDSQELILNIGNYAIVFLILFLLYRNKIFIKI